MYFDQMYPLQSVLSISLSTSSVSQVYVQFCLKKLTLVGDAGMCMGVEKNPRGNEQSTWTVVLKLTNSTSASR